MSEIFITESDFRNRYQYKSSDLLGEGGFAQVYKAYDRQFEEFVALKFYNKGEQGKYDVLHEMKDSRKYSHPNIIRVHDAFIVRFDHTGGHSFVQVGILEYANGGNLRDFINSSPTEEQFVSVLTGILHALDYLHRDKKIIHRDLSPENILMYVDGDIWVPKIADFGISKKMDYVSDAKDQKKSTQLLGKVDYMAPEQFYPEKYGIKGKLHTNVDLWAFGIILYELFTHHKPFGCDSIDNPLKIIHSIEKDPISNLNDIPNPYRTVVKRCLEKKAKDRAKSATELISLLEGSSIKSDNKYSKTAPVKHLEHKAKKRYFLYAGMILPFLITAGYLIVHFQKKSEQLPPPYDPVLIQAEIRDLVEQNQYNAAIARINLLPADIRSTNEIMDLYTQSKTLKKVDSIILRGDQLFSKEQYNLAKLQYSQVINTYHISDQELENKIVRINYIMDSLSNMAQKVKTKTEEEKENLKKQEITIPEEKENEGVGEQTTSSPGRLYLKGMFTVTRAPDKDAIDLISIQITDEKTIISLKLYATTTAFSIQKPGSSGAYRIEYNKRKESMPLLDVRGIVPGKYNGLRKDTEIQLYFSKLPADVSVFNLVLNTEKMDESKEYWNFIGIRL